MGLKDFFGSVGKGVKKVGAKFDNAVDLQKLKFNITKKEDEIDEICENFGREVLLAVIEGRDYTEVLENAKALYLEKVAELEAMNQERRKREGYVLCVNCGNEVDSSSDFCPKCGAKIEKEAEEVASDETGEETDPE